MRGVSQNAGPTSGNLGHVRGLMGPRSFKTNYFEKLPIYQMPAPLVQKEVRISWQGPEHVVNFSCIEAY